MTSKDIINWRALSRALTGKDLNIRSKRIPKKYQRVVGKLLVLIDWWLKKYGDEFTEKN